MSRWRKKLKNKFAKLKFNKPNYGNKKVNNFMKVLIIKRHQRSSIEEKVIKFFVTIALRVAIRPHHWKDKRKNKEIIIKTYQKIVSKDFSFVPPAFAFYLVMAFMPIITLFFLIASFWPAASKLAESTIDSFIHLEIKGIINFSIFKESPSALVASLFFLILAAWIASAGFAKFVVTQSYLYNHKRIGGFWMNRLRGMSIVLAFATYTVLATFFFALGPKILFYLGLKESTTFYNILFYIGNIGGGFLFLYFGFVFLFKFSPRFKLTWRQVHPGSVVATIPTLLFILLFGTISKFAFNYQKFGIIAPIMTLSAMMFIFSYFIYVGMITNSTFYNVHHSINTIAKPTVSKK